MSVKTHIHLSTAKPDESLQFYLGIGFVVIAEGNNPIPWWIITDYSVIIQLNQDEKKGFGFVYYGPELEKTVNLIRSKNLTSNQRGKAPRDKVWTFKGPGDFTVSFVQEKAPLDPYPLLTNFKDYTEAELKDIAVYPNAVLGMFGELAIPVENVKRAANWWKKFGFLQVFLNKTPYPWGIMIDQVHTVGLHQTDDFTAPAITYFARDMDLKIENLIQSGFGDRIVPFTGTESGKGNAILNTFEDRKILLFKL